MEIFKPMKLSRVLGNDNDVYKHFPGDLYYHLERSNKLHWDLNGDFFNNETTIVINMMI